MIVCHNCGKENQDHYKFCLGCGSELRRDKVKAKPAAPTPPSGFARPSQPDGAIPPPALGLPQLGGQSMSNAPMGNPSMSGPPPVMGPPMAQAAPPAPTGPVPAYNPPASGMGAPPSTAAMASGPGMASVVSSSSTGSAPNPMPSAPPAAAAGEERVTCPRCGTSNPRSFKFCGSCGFDLHAWLADQEGAPTTIASDPSAVRPPPRDLEASRGGLVRINQDGTEGERIPLQSSTSIGRSKGGGFSDDAYLSPNHATFKFQGAGLVVKDENSLNGVWIRIGIEEPHELEDGTMFRIGQEIIRFETLRPKRPDSDVEVQGAPREAVAGRVSLVVGRDTTLNGFVVPESGLHLGRERGEVLFPEDGYVSGLHCRIHGENGRAFLTDLGSSNGTYIRVRGEQAIKPGTFVLMGHQIFRVEY
jgi:pSer/pThr/pTyr-binding forkhead associated (FHA) protein